MSDVSDELIMDSAAPLGEPAEFSGGVQEVEAGMVLLGRYHLRQKLGEGGFGAVWLADDQVEGGEVALKVLKAELGTRHDARRRFEVEVRSAARLCHRRIATLLDAGVDDVTGAACFTMEVVRGGALQEADITVADKLVFFDQLLEALAYAHARGIVHRDLKPDNLLIAGGDASATLRLLDFGVARVTDPVFDPASFNESFEDAPIGTPHYMSPEQAAGESSSVGPASDLYSAGVVLHELLSGSLPFEGPFMALLYAHVAREAPRLSKVEGLPDGMAKALEDLVAGLLAKDYTERPECAADVRAALRPILDSLEPTVSLSYEIVEPEPPPASLQDLRDWPMFGRHGLRRDLWRAVAKPDAPLDLIIVTGPLGIGKRRLTRWLAETVHERGTMRRLRLNLGESANLAAAVHGALYHYARRPRLEATALRERTASLFSKLDEDTRATLDRFLLRGGRAEESFRGTQGTVVGGLEAWVDAIVAVATTPAPRPTLLWIDGVGSADVGEVDGFLARLRTKLDSVGTQCLAVWTRDSPLDAASSTALRSAGVRVRHIAVGPLGEEAQQALVTAMVPSANSDTKHTVIARCSGNPRLIRDTLLRWIQDESIDPETGALSEAARLTAPLSVQEEFAARIARFLERHDFDPRVHRALKLLAWVGATFDGAVVGLVLKSVPTTLADLLASGVVVDRGEGRTPHYSLTDPVTAGILKERARVAGETRGLVVEAAEVRILAGYKAMGTCDWNSALDHLHAAWDILDRGGITGPESIRADVLDAITLVCTRQRDSGGVRSHALTLHMLGDEFGALSSYWLGVADFIDELFDEGNSHFQRSLRSDDAEIRARTLHQLGRIALVQGKSAREQLEEARHVLSEIAMAAEPPRRSHRTALQAADVGKEVAQAWLSEGEPAVASALLRSLIGEYAGLADVQGEAYAFVLLTRALRTELQTEHFTSGEALEELRSNLLRAEQLMEGLEDRRGHALVAWETAMLLLTEERWADAEAYFDWAGKLFATAKDTFGQALARNSAGEAARRGKRYREAIAHYEAFLTAMEGFANPQGMGVAHMNLGYAKLDAALYADALPHFVVATGELAEAVGPHHPTALVGRAEAEAKLGNAVSAEGSLREVLTWLDGKHLDDPDAQKAAMRLRLFAEDEGLTGLWSLSRRLAKS